MITYATKVKTIIEIKMTIAEIMIKPGTGIGATKDMSAIEIVTLGTTESGIVIMTAEIEIIAIDAKILLQIDEVITVVG